MPVSVPSKESNSERVRRCYNIGQIKNALKKMWLDCEIMID